MVTMAAHVKKHPHAAMEPSNYQGFSFTELARLITW